MRFFAEYQALCGHKWAAMMYRKASNLCLMRRITDSSHRLAASRMYFPETTTLPGMQKIFLRSVRAL